MVSKIKDFIGITLIIFFDHKINIFLLLIRNIYYFFNLIVQNRPNIHYFFYFRNLITNLFINNWDNLCQTFDGVEIPHTDGRAGMAAITLNEGCQLDEQDLRQMLVEFKKAMPAYAVPVFLRIQKQMQTTGTFKYQKNTLKTQGFDLKQCDEKILVLLPNQSAYCELTQEIYNNIQQYQYRF